MPAGAKPSSSRAGALLLTPAVSALAMWMVVPLLLTVWFSFQRYNLLNPQSRTFAGLANFSALLVDSGLWTALLNTLLMVGGVLTVSITLGVLVAVLFDRPFPGRPVARLLVIAPFFVMPTVGALVWKNLLLHPVNGLFAAAARAVGIPGVDWFTEWPLLAIVGIVSWQWAPFAALVFMTSLQSIDPSLRDAASIDGAGARARFRYIMLPHLGRAIGVVVMIETIFLLSLFAEILVTTNGGPGLATTNLAFMIYARALLHFDVGSASATGLLAIFVANIVAFFFMRTLSHSLTE